MLKGLNIEDVNEEVINTYSNMCFKLNKKVGGGCMPSIECVTDEVEVMDCFTDCSPSEPD